MWYVEGGGNYIIRGEKVFGRNVMATLDEVESNIRNRFKNVDVFATIYMYDQIDQSKANLFAPLYIDLDLKFKSDNDYQKVKRDLLHVVTALNITYSVPMEYIRVYFSGNKGFHVLVDPEIFGIEPGPSLNELYRAVAHDLKKITMFKTVDTGIYDRVRLFRLPNSIHGETGLYKVPVSIDFIRSSTFQDIVEYASMPKEMEFPEPRLVRDAAIKFYDGVNRYRATENIIVSTDGTRKVYANNNKKMMPCIVEMLQTPAAPHTRNKTTVIIASSMCQSGFDHDDTLEQLIQWNRQCNSPSLTDREIKTTVKSAYSQFANKGMGYGCRAIKELDMCLPENCRIAKK